MQLYSVHHRVDANVAFYTVRIDVIRFLSTPHDRKFWHAACHHQWVQCDREHHGQLSGRYIRDMDSTGPSNAHFWSMYLDNVDHVSSSPHRMYPPAICFRLDSSKDSRSLILVSITYGIFSGACEFDEWVTISIVKPLNTVGFSLTMGGFAWFASKPQEIGYVTEMFQQPSLKSQDCCIPYSAPASVLPWPSSASAF